MLRHWFARNWFARNPAATADRDAGDLRGEITRLTAANAALRHPVAADRAADAAPSPAADAAPSPAADAARSPEQAVILAQLAEGVIVTDAAGRITFVNEAAERLHGVRLLGVGPHDYTDTYRLLTEAGEPYPPLELPLSRAVLRGETVLDARWRIRRPDGTEILAIGSARPLQRADGGPAGAVLTVRDDTERDRATRRLERRSAQLQGLAAAALTVADAPDLAATLDALTEAAHRIVGAHQGMASLTRGRGWDQAIHAVALTDRYAAWRDYAAPPDGSGIYAWVCERNRPARLTQAELEAHPRWRGFGRHAGEHPPMRGWLAAPMVARDGRNLGLIQLSDRTDGGEFDASDEAVLVQLAQLGAAAVEQLEADAALRELNGTLEQRVAERTADRDRMWRLSGDLMLVARFDGAIAAVNPAWTSLLGWREAELVGRSFLDLVHPDDLAGTTAEATALAEGRVTLRFENRYRHRDGSYCWLSWTAVPDADFIHAVARDMTAERAAAAELGRAQDALRQAQKMEAVGQLTGGIAHDFNNMLAVVIGSLDLLGRRIDGGDARARRYLDAAHEGARRAALLTQRLLAFSRQQALSPVALDANRLVAGMADLLRHSIGGAIRLETVLAGGLWQTYADPNQLENALLNLAVNARDAMPDGGRLTIETQNAHLDARYAQAHFGVPAGQYVLIAVTDTGIGMPSAVIARAFDPFFTTKEVGKGTGLGLSQVYGFIKQSGGHVKIYSEAGQGTTVKVYLPRRLGPAEDMRDAAGAVDLALGDSLDVVLVVEDEPAVRQFSVDAVAELGYRVLEADGAAQALRLLDAHPEITLLFTDVVMPDVNGRRLADAVRRRRPDVKILFTTGYTRNAVVHNGVLDAGVQLISKPFTIEELAAKLREVLEGSA